MSLTECPWHRIRRCRRTREQGKPSAAYARGVNGLKVPVNRAVIESVLRRGQDGRPGEPGGVPTGVLRRAGDWIMGVLGNAKAMLDSARAKDGTATAGLATRFRHIQERGSKHAADAGVEVAEIPKLIRGERATAAELSEADALLEKSLSRRARR